ncbi:hypothetical protein E2C01_054629 [Portunus trituberculatus]|uniref:Uncharacterized protein n=1 Tax=Portunus trituberculatus TaxID=210409 RepID=A0A5B7GTQ6_PORTR|nr:hypothetical protein [Portunus trituberculatus]
MPFSSILTNISHIASSHTTTTTITTLTTVLFHQLPSLRWRRSARQKHIYSSSSRAVDERQRPGSRGNAGVRNCLRAAVAMTTMRTWR